MKLEVKEKFEIPDGIHEGVIVDVQYRETPYKYTDLMIDFMVNKQSVSG